MTSESGGHGHSDEYWRALLSGEDKQLGRIGRFFRSIPSAPRCKLCFAPFSGPFAPVFKLLGFRRWALNQQMCRFCVTSLEKHSGGAEVPVSLLFADVRGSTSLAERMSPSDYRSSLDRFFATVFEAVDAESGVIEHRRRRRDGHVDTGLRWARSCRASTRSGQEGRTRSGHCARSRGLVPAGVGVHTGVAVVGVVRETGSNDFTTLGDVPNTTARLGSAAEGGELAMSEAIVAAADVDTTALERRVLDPKGKAEPFPAWIEAVAASSGVD